MKKLHTKKFSAFANIVILLLALVGTATALEPGVASIPPPSDDGCYYHAAHIPVSCEGGTIQSDTYSDCRYVTCESDDSSLTAKACNKPGDDSPTHIEVYKTASSGDDDLEVCFGEACVDGSGYAVQQLPYCPDQDDQQPPYTEKLIGEHLVLEHCPGYEYPFDYFETAVYDIGDMCYVEYVNTQTPIWFEAKDDDSGVKETWYRILWVEDDYYGEKICGHESGAIPEEEKEFDDYCDPEYYTEYTTASEWMLFDGEFSHDEESCHIIEYYSVDHAGNQEDMQWNCMFVDDTAPKWYKEVGQPSMFIGEGGDEVCDEVVVADHAPVFDAGPLPPAGGATVSPDFLQATLNPGESVVEHKIITTDETPIGLLDVLFEFDLTGSMEDDLEDAQASAADMIDDITALVGDAAFGVGSFMDYDGFHSSCGYSATYGDNTFSGDYPWSLDADITTDKATVTSALSGLTLGFGEDGPEAYARALHEALGVSWRPGAKRVVVIFEDNVPHDCSLGSYGCFDSTTGADLGPDGVVGGGDDLVWADVVADLKAAGITVVVLEADFGVCDGPWEHLTDETGGIFAEIDNADDLSDSIVDLLDEVTSEISEVTLMAAPGFEDWLSWEPDAHYNVTGNMSVDFNVTITVPEDTVPGHYHFYLKVVGDGSVIAVQQIQITVPGEAEPPKDDEPPEQCGDGYDWKVDLETPIHLTCEDQDPHPVGYEQVCFSVYDLEEDEDITHLISDYCDLDVKGEDHGYCCLPFDDVKKVIDVDGVDELEKMPGVWFTFPYYGDFAVEFYCQDALWNMGEHDREIFNVMPLDGDICEESVCDLPATCSRGDVIYDHCTLPPTGPADDCRHVVCQDGADILHAKACEKPNEGPKEYFDLWVEKHDFADPFNPIEVCVGDACVNHKFTSYDRGDLCEEDPEISAEVLVAPWFPMGLHYVFLCETEGFTPTMWSWDFGDGDTQMDSPNQNVYHVFEANGVYDVTCVASDGVNEAQDTLQVVTSGFI